MDTEISRRAPSLAEMSTRLQAAVKADKPELRASTVAREVKARTPNPNPTVQGVPKVSISHSQIPREAFL
jgi:hypothetical protein